MSLRVYQKASWSGLQFLPPDFYSCLAFPPSRIYGWDLCTLCFQADVCQGSYHSKNKTKTRQTQGVTNTHPHNYYLGDCLVAMRILSEIHQKNLRKDHDRYTLAM